MKIVFVEPIGAEIPRGTGVVPLGVAGAENLLVPFGRLCPPRNQIRA